MSGGIFMPAYRSRTKRPVLIDRTAGSIFGNMNNRAGLAAAFDGNNVQATAACAGNTSSNNSWIGKTLVAPRVFAKAVAYGSTDNGYKTTGDPIIQLRILGKVGAAPASIFDGTLLGTISFGDTTNESAGRSIDSTDFASAWDHLWLTIEGGGSGGANVLAELELYAWE